MSFLLVNFGKGHGSRGIVAMSHTPKFKSFDQNLILFWHPVNHGQFHLNFRLKSLFSPWRTKRQKQPTKKNIAFFPKLHLVCQTKTSSSVATMQQTVETLVFLPTVTTVFCSQRWRQRHRLQVWTTALWSYVVTSFAVSLMCSWVIVVIRSTSNLRVTCQTSLG